MHQVPAMLAMWQSLYSHKKKERTKKDEEDREREREVRKEEGYRALLSPKELPRRAKAGETPLVVASLRRRLRRTRQSRHAPLTHTTSHHAHAHTLAHTHRAAVASVRLLNACCNDDDGRVSLAPYSVATTIFQRPAAALLFSLSLFAGTTPSTHTQPLSRLHQTLYIKRHPLTACIGKRDRNLHSARM